MGGHKSEVQKDQRQSLVIGSSVLRSIDESKVKNTIVVPVSGAKISDITNEMKQDKNKYKKVQLCVGSNNVKSESTSEDIMQICEDYKDLFDEVKEHSEDVCITSIPLRTDTPNIDEVIDKVNAELITICKDMNVDYVDLDPMFRLADGEVNDGYLHDGVHLTKQGTCKMAKIMNLTMEADTEFSDIYCKPYTRCTKPYGKIATSDDEEYTVVVNNKKKKSYGYNQTENRKQDRYAPKGQKESPCWKCGELSHLQVDCHHSGPLQCHKCLRYGHKSHYCYRFPK